ncbi:MAG: COR domain-containing protein [Cyanobacteria bacterium P01_B01_bin.77]
MTQDELLRLIDQATTEGWTTLDLSSQDLTELPPEIGQLTSLKSLNLRSNRLSSLPPEIGQLTSLKSLAVNSNRLNSLPPEIGQLARLQSLTLSYNRLRISLPPEIGQLTNLQSLTLSYNRLISLPPEIGQLTNLQSLTLSYNQLRISLPPEIGQLTKLQSLDLRSNQLSLPPEIRQLTKLQSLDLSYNQLSLPPEIGQFTGLQSLDLSYNQLSLPPEIRQLTSLQSLNLRSNQLSLPPEIGQLTDLQSLNLSSNQLSSLPPEIGQLTDLPSLDLSHNQLSSLPPEIGQLTDLPSLDLSHNQLSSLPPEIGQLTNLPSLDLSNNQLSSLPPEIGQLTNLPSLDLSNNRLSSLPPEIGQLTNLQSLDLSNNRLSSLPPEIGQLTNLQSLDLSNNNSLTDPPPEIIQEGTAEILNYLRQQLEQGKDFIYEAKFLIVGEGGAGKTSLAKKIKDASCELDSDEASTEGIDVMRWEFNFKKDRSFRVNIWDFGGQEIYHSTHQFFLTKRSLYAFVVDTREDNADLYYWLNIVRLLSGDSPVFIIKNEKQDRTCRVNERQLRGEFLSLKEILATNLKTNRGLSDIKAMIQSYISALPHVGQALPKKWVDVRKSLEDDSRNYITLSEYHQICEANDFRRQKDQLQLSDYLHDLGVCLHFQADPLLKKILILKPEWGTTAVYKALDTKEIQENLGRFSRSQLDIIWSEHQYADMRDELLQLMINFKLCYKIPGTDNEYIAPQLLDVEQPAYDWDNSNNLFLRYRYDFMPKGVLTRLIVEMHKFIEAQSLVWKSGVVLTNGDTRAEVIELYHRGEIHLRLNGVRPKELRTVITHEIDQINNSFDRIRVQKLIPCSCSVCNGSEDPHFYHLDKLYERIANDKQTIECGKPPYEDVLVRGLIDKISQLLPSSQKSPGEKMKNFWPIQTEPNMKTPKVFISYAHKDEHFKDELVTTLASMQRRNIIDAWQDRRIEPGKEWYQAIQTAMGECDIAVLLVSRAFLASRFINEEEIPRLLQRRRDEGMRVIPIIVRPCTWISEPVLKDLQALPRDNKAVITFAEENGDRDQAWTDIAEAIETIAKGFQTN